jgi:hypothetical protein
MVAAVITALATVLLSFSHDVRPYMLLTFLTASAVYCLLVAERTGAIQWWLGFAALMQINLLNSYLTLIMVIPTLAPYLLWVLWRLWRQGRGGRKQFYFALLSYAIVGVSAALTYLGMSPLPRGTARLSKLIDPTAYVAAMFKFFSSLNGFGFAEQLERVAHLGLFLIMLTGFYVGVRLHKPSARGTILCTWLVVAPVIGLVVLSTASPVFERYGVYAAPFCFLLISNTLVLLVSAAYKADLLPGRRRVAKALAIVVAGVVFSCYVAGAYNYNTPAGFAKLTFRPDFRGASAYLSRVVKPGDLIIIVDDPAHGQTVTNFYWRDKPPTTAYHALDPRLVDYTPEGDIYWIVSLFQDSSGRSDSIAAPQHGWAEVVHLNQLLVLRESKPGGKAVDSLDRMVSILEGIRPGYQPIKTLRATVYHLRGDIAAAARAYRDAGYYLPLGDEYKNTVEGFTARGDLVTAYEEAILFKFVEPFRPEVHRWLSDRLREQGHVAASRIEADMAQALQSLQKAR